LPPRLVDARSDPVDLDVEKTSTARIMRTAFSGGNRGDLVGDLNRLPL